MIIMGFEILLLAFQSRKDHECLRLDLQLHVNFNLYFLDIMDIHLFVSSILSYLFSLFLIKICFTFVIHFIYFLHSVYLYSFDFKLEILV